MPNASTPAHSSRSKKSILTTFRPIFVVESDTASAQARIMNEESSSFTNSVVKPFSLSRKANALGSTELSLCFPTNVSPFSTPMNYNANVHVSFSALSSSREYQLFDKIIAVEVVQTPSAIPSFAESLST